MMPAIVISLNSRSAGGNWMPPGFGAGEEQRDRARGNHRGDRRACRTRSRSPVRSVRRDRHRSTHAGDLGRFADERAERRGVAERVATDDRVERVEESEAVGRLDAERPRGGARRRSAVRRAAGSTPRFQPICRKPVQISAGPTVHTSQANSAVPATAVSRPTAVIWRRGAVEGTAPSYNRRAMLPASFQMPAAIILLVGGLLSCFAGYRVFRFVLAFFGFVLGALCDQLRDGGGSDAVDDRRARLLGGLVGALILVAGYFVGVALIGAGHRRAASAMAIWAALGREPGMLPVLMLSILGALAALALQRYVIIVEHRVRRRADRDRRRGGADRRQPRPTWRHAACIACTRSIRSRRRSGI